VKRFLFGSVLLAALASASACGLYTNVPAQIKVAQVVGATLFYEKPDATDGWREVKIEDPTMTLVGEPGSIGVTYEKMKVDYLQINEKPVAAGEIPPMDLRVSIRVESSNFPSDPLAGPLSREQMGVALAVGKTTVTLPIVTRHVSAYGAKVSENVAALSAQLTLKGVDDAGYPAELIVYVPITFQGPPGTGK
jgi:hypothetical protein